MQLRKRRSVRLEHVRLSLPVGVDWVELQHVRYSEWLCARERRLQAQRRTLACSHCLAELCKSNYTVSRLFTQLTISHQYSNKTSDTWIAYRHSQIQILKPKVLIVNFVNPTLGTTKAETLVNTIIRAFADGSRPRGNMTATARLQYQIAKFVNLRGSPKITPA